MFLGSAVSSFQRKSNHPIIHTHKLTWQPTYWNCHASLSCLNCSWVLSPCKVETGKEHYKPLWKLYFFFIFQTYQQHILWGDSYEPPFLSGDIMLKKPPVLSHINISLVRRLGSLVTHLSYCANPHPKTKKTQQKTKKPCWIRRFGGCWSLQTKIWRGGGFPPSPPLLLPPPLQFIKKEVIEEKLEPQ